MCTWRSALLVAALLAGSATFAQQRFPGIGRTATPAEVAAWDIDVRADFRGLPKGSGSVARGQVVWEAKCASCHGVFGESNEVFTPIVGGTTDEDIRTGRVANLMRPDYPGRTTLMKLSTLSTLWDYINRAMPWNAPKSLTTEEVYAVTAYILNLGRVVPDDFTLDDTNIADVQKRLPNRNGTTTAHAMWPGREFKAAPRPDVKALACMANCTVEPKVVSLIPDYALNAHGNLAEQNRGVGPQRGMNTAGATVAQAPVQAPAARAAATASASAGKAVADLLQKNTCTACHAQDRRLVGPSWTELASKYAGKGDYIAGKIRAGGSGVWGAIPMPPQAISEPEALRIAQWLASGAPP